jgi:hypothetical protein
MACLTVAYLPLACPTVACPTVAHTAFFRLVKLGSRTKQSLTKAVEQKLLNKCRQTKCRRSKYSRTKCCQTKCSQTKYIEQNAVEQNVVGQKQRRHRRITDKPFFSFQCVTVGKNVIFCLSFVTEVYQRQHMKPHWFGWWPPQWSGWLLVVVVIFATRTKSLQLDVGEIKTNLFGGSATPCAFPPPWPSIFSNYSFLVHQPVNRDNRQLLAHAMDSDFTVAWHRLRTNF